MHRVRALRGPARAARQLIVSDRPPAHHHPALRYVALLEATKGIAAVIIAIAIWLLVHRHPESSAAHLVRMLHIHRTGAVARLITHAVEAFAPGRAPWVFAGVGLYVVARMTEAVGLWRERAWAEWFGIITGALYVPFEIYEIARRPTAMAIGVFVLNVVVVSYLAFVRWESMRTVAIPMEA